MNYYFTFIQTCFLWLVIKAKTSFPQIPDFLWNGPKIFKTGIRFLFIGIIIGFCTWKEVQMSNIRMNSLKEVVNNHQDLNLFQIFCQLAFIDFFLLLCRFGVKSKATDSIHCIIKINPE